MNGKDKCELLKSIRVRLSELNKITYTPHPCNNTEDCCGTCDACDAESKWLLHTMKELESKGYPIIYSLNDNNDHLIEFSMERNIVTISDYEKTIWKAYFDSSYM